VYAKFRVTNAAREDLTDLFKERQLGQSRLKSCFYRKKHNMLIVYCSNMPNRVRNFNRNQPPILAPINYLFLVMLALQLEWNQ